MLSFIDLAIILSMTYYHMNDNINIDSIIARSMNDNINLHRLTSTQKTTYYHMNDNINLHRLASTQTDHILSHE
jgi:hypothetical protein